MHQLVEPYYRFFQKELYRLPPASRFTTGFAEDCGIPRVDFPICCCMISNPCTISSETGITSAAYRSPGSATVRQIVYSDFILSGKKLPVDKITFLYIFALFNISSPLCFEVRLVSEYCLIPRYLYDST